MGLALDEPTDEDEKLSVGELEILVEPRAAAFADQSIIDYVDSVWGRGFSIRPIYGGGC